MTEDTISLSGLSLDDKRYLLELLNDYDERLRYNKLDYWFPDTGPYARHKYQKHVDFMNAGSRIRERALFGGNRVGKSTTAAYEVACHLTGLYPKWWKGARFDHPISAVCLGITHHHVRDVAQFLLLGNVNDVGTGMIPKHCLSSKPYMKQGIPNGISQIEIDHYDEFGVYDGKSIVDFMSYDQGYEVLQGTIRHVTWEDEECPDPQIHAELVTRGATVDGAVNILTFTPLKGLTATVLSFLPDGMFPYGNIYTTPEGVQRWITRIEWDDIPHLSDKAKAEILAAYGPHEREARSKGIPTVGSGKVFTTLEENFVVDPFPIPASWPKSYGLDVGWNRTAAVFFAVDPSTGTVYTYDEYYVGQERFETHAFAIQQRGKWIRGAVDPSSKRSGDEGKKAFVEYRRYGLNLSLADNAVEPGILKMQTALSSNRWKVFSTCKNLIKEYRLYRRDSTGKLDRHQDDHALDAARYWWNTGFKLTMPTPDEFAEYDSRKDLIKRNRHRDPITGC